jgi:hypothetical protein
VDVHPAPYLDLNPVRGVSDLQGADTLASRNPTHDGGSIGGYLLMIGSALRGETKGLQVKYHRMGRLRVDKKILRDQRW